MPGPDTSNRERLLRLIDGGADAIREVAEERSAKPVETPSPVASSAAAEATPKVAPAPVQASPAAKGSVKIHPVTRWLVPIILVALVLLGVGLVSQFIDSLRQKPVQPAVEGAAAAPEPAPPTVTIPPLPHCYFGARPAGCDTRPAPCTPLRIISRLLRRCSSSCSSATDLPSGATGRRRYRTRCRGSFSRWRCPQCCFA